MLKYISLRNIHVEKNVREKNNMHQRIRSYYPQNYYDVSDSSINPMHFFTDCLTTFNVQL